MFYAVSEGIFLEILSEELRQSARAARFCLSVGGPVSLRTDRAERPQPRAVRGPVSVLPQNPEGNAAGPLSPALGLLHSRGTSGTGPRHRRRVFQQTLSGGRPADHGGGTAAPLLQLCLSGRGSSDKGRAKDRASRERRGAARFCLFYRKTPFPLLLRGLCPALAALLPL